MNVNIHSRANGNINDNVNEKQKDGNDGNGNGNENPNELNYNTEDSTNSDENGLAERVGMLQQQLKQDISNVVDNKAYTADNPSMGGHH